MEKVSEFEGKNVEDAIEKALSTLKLKREDVRIEVIDEGKAGIIGIGSSRPAKIKVYYKEKRDEESVARDFLINLIKRMGITDIRVRRMTSIGNKIYIELDSKDSGLIIGKHGTVLEALQTVVNLGITREFKGTRKRIIIDIENYRNKREATLKRLSKEIADKVAKTKKPVLLEPMNPFERRIVHLALQNDRRVITKSEGEGIYRQIRVIPR